MGRQPKPNAAFDEAFVDLYPRVRAMAYRLLGDDLLADDVAAESLARLLVHWARVGELPYRDGWVLRVGSNLALDHVRKRKTDARRAAMLVASLDHGDHGDSGDTVVLREALVQALTALPRRQREAIVLVYLVGLTPGETARAMSVSSSSVSQHMRRGLGHLRGQLSDAPLGVRGRGVGPVRSQEEALEAVYARAGQLQRRRRAGRVLSTAACLVVVVGLLAAIVQQRSGTSAIVDAGDPQRPTTVPPPAEGSTTVVAVPAPVGRDGTGPAGATGAGRSGTTATDGRGAPDAQLPACAPEDLRASATWLSDQVQPVDGVFDAQPSIDSVIDHDCLMRFSPLTVTVQNAAGFEYFHYVEPRVLVSLRAAARSGFYYGNVLWDSSCRDARVEVSVCERATPGEYTMTIDFFGFRRTLPLTVTPA